MPALVDESPAAVALAVGAALGGRALAPLGTRLPVGDLAHAVIALGATDLVVSRQLAALAVEVGAVTNAAVHVLPDDFPPTSPSGAVVAGSDPVLVVHTSGTTGAPKAVTMTHKAMVARIEVYGDAIELAPGDRYCSASPFHHTAGVAMALTALGRGAAVVPQAWFSVDGWRAAGAAGITHALLVPTMIDLLLEAGALGDACPRVLQYGAAPIHPATLEAALVALPSTRFAQIFGQTEVSPITVLTHEDHLAGRLTSVGRPVAGLELRIEGADGDGVGELAVRAPHVFVHDDDGWRRTGDLGLVDADGYVTLRGRANDLIVRGGENIYPLEVELALAAHPGVREVAVVGVPDRRYGDLVRAAVVPVDPEAPPAVDDLIAWARARLAPFKVPNVVDLVDALPRNANGKLVRRALIDQLEGTT